MKISKLKLWLCENEMTQRELARIVDCTPNHIYGVVNGRTKPGKRLAMQISEATNGLVTLEELMSKKLVGNTESV